MKIHLYTIRDRAQDAFLNPFAMLAHGQAIRYFTDQVNRADPDNQLHSHPDDFDLYYVGTFDTSDGKFETQVPEQISIGKNVAVRSQ